MPAIIEAAMEEVKELSNMARKAREQRLNPNDVVYWLERAAENMRRYVTLAHESDRTELTWTAEPPTKVGWYWRKSTWNMMCTIIHVNEYELPIPVFSTGQNPLWAGPIPEPRAAPPR